MFILTNTRVADMEGQVHYTEDELCWALLSLATSGESTSLPWLPVYPALKWIISSSRCIKVHIKVMMD